MNVPHGSLFWLLAFAALAVPLGFALSAVFVTRADPLRGIRHVTRVAVALSFGVGAGWWRLGRGSSLVLELPPRTDAWLAGPALRLDAAGCVVLPLVCAVAWAVARFSRSYLTGDPRRVRYARSLAATLAAVTLLVITDHLMVMALAWTATSLALHALLTHHAERPQALIAAHKKFLVSRLADVAVYAAVVLLAHSAGSARISAVVAWAEHAPSLGVAAQWAAVLLAAGVCLKCAQLPFHGWLTQVMEAPTPVSALLHAGVVNIGGFVLIRLAPWISRAPAAQTLLVAVGAATAVVGALVTSTRVSVKVALAWSTIAQMGFMLVQCGLGAWSLALLHLLAHSLYKAHAFLGSGSTVESWRVRAVAPPSRTAPSLRRWWATGALSLLGVGAAGWLVGLSPQREPALWVLGGVLGLAIVPLLVRGRGRGLHHAALGALAVVALYFTWHALVAGLFPAAVATTATMAWRLGLAAAAFVSLFALQGVLQARAHGRLARALHPHLFAGLYLDELFTRATFWLWPPRRPAAPSRERALPVRKTAEA